MGEPEIPLAFLPVGHRARVVKVGVAGLTRNRLLDLGLVPSTVVEAVRRSPAGDPVAYNIRGAIIALRSEESRLITVRPLAVRR
ncbi:MAG TPA: ferrous iron transport protein A [Firmicutes bacterium]|uniref:Ferrous iron transport protein A n=1 Tax=Capillibacterium thermochitinicola TaxID=2699427 RepID=A0A8J6HWQ8_9FIRM|nr:FeoA family protein [Capillibacterium thermochitinicola]MBA2132702.1 ferrous iron transport protein A [Capillibacterium thermochitinicola]HHW12705.1 ferrous iron transport protein A [Bacillota bacterium]